MKIASERLPKSLIALDIEPDAATIEKEMNKAAKRVANKVNIPGFRKGKAPRFMIENYYGREIIREEATDEIIQVAFKAAIKQEGIDPVAQATIEKVEFDPFRFRVLVPVEPTITLGDYHAISVPLNEEEITDELVEHSMDSLREKHVVLQSPEGEREAQDSDQLTVVMESFDGEGNLLDEREEGQEPEESPVVLDAKRILPDLYQGLLGVKAGEERSITTTLPDDHPNEKVAGKEVTFKVQVKDIQQRLLPEWDELPALQEFEGDIDALRADTRQRLTTNAGEHARRELLNAYIEELVKVTEYDIPDAMIHERADEMLHQQVGELSRYGISLEQYLQITNKTHDSAVEELLGPAEESLKSSLALREIVAREGLAVEPSEVDAEVETLLLDYPEDRRDFVRERLNSDLRSSVAASVLDKKLRDRIVAIATGAAPAAPAAEAAEEGEQTA
ncbi:MAG TPA: trigger factor [Herpetosiphonaceae bacterium]